MDIFPTDLNFRLIKILDIGFITILYFIIGVIFSRILDWGFGKFNKKNDKCKSLLYISLELVFMIWIIGTSTYFIRNVVELIPSPFEGISGLVHKKVKELGGAGVYTLIVMSCAYHFRDKLDEFNKRFDKEFSFNIFRSSKPSSKIGITSGTNGDTIDTTLK